MVGEETRRVSISTIFVFHFLLPQSRNNTLTFVEAPALAPAEVAVDADLMDQYQKELTRVRLPQVLKKIKIRSFHTQGGGCTPSGRRRGPLIHPILPYFALCLTSRCLKYTSSITHTFTFNPVAITFSPCVFS